MRFHPSFRLVPLLIMMLGLLVFETAQAQDSRLIALPTNAEGIPIVARVNDAEITLPELERAALRYELQQAQLADPTLLQSIVLNTLIEQELIVQAAAEQGITVSEDELNSELLMNEQLAGGREGWLAWLATNGYTEEEFRETLRQTLVTARMRDLVTAELLGQVPHVRSRHILVLSQAQAESLLARLNNGEDFAALAAQYSIDETTSRQGGDLGWFTQDELIEPTLARVAFALEPNMIAGPIETMLGYHIIQTLERANRSIEIERLPDLAQLRFENWLGSVIAEAVIVRYL